MSTIVTFGEIMCRMAPAHFLRLRQALPGTLDVTFAGAEANVAASICRLGGRARFVTALPKHAVADACVGTLSGLGIDTRYIVRSDTGRMGIYFVETGANQRPGTVVYDREGSCLSCAAADAFDWQAALAGASWLHVTGITPSLSRTAAETLIAVVRLARAKGVSVSCDLNFRNKLWRWGKARSPHELAQATMREILPFADLVIANEEDAADVLGIHAGKTDVAAGQLAVDQYPAVAREIASQFPNLSRVAITLRESISASHNNWGGMLLEIAEDRAYFAPEMDGGYRPYEIRHIVDRVGAGDAFAAGLLFALGEPELASPQRAVSFAVAASCLAHSIYGDFNYTTRAEVEALMQGTGAGRVVR
jgi:2-dehydro-3-deoxygluconokinase